MSGPIVDLATQFTAAAPGTAMVGANTRVKGQPGFLGTALDVLSFGDGSVGQWTVPDTRTRILGNFTVSQSSQGVAVLTVGGTAPVTVIAGDSAIQSQ